MKTLFLSITIFTLSIFLFSGCQSVNQSNTTDTPTKSGLPAEKVEEASLPLKITSEQAKEKMDENEDIVILDVRTTEEYLAGHIEGALLIPDYELEDKAEELLDPSSTILIYCRSGNRSSKAAKALSQLGYKNIYDFGGIIDWPYDIVIE